MTGDAPTPGTRRERRRKTRAETFADASAPVPAIKGQVKTLSRSKAVTALRRRIAQRISREDIWESLLFSEEIYSNDRVLALVLCAILEQSLEAAILSHCTELSLEEQQKLFGPPEEAPVTFDIKTRIAYALGIFGPDSRDDIVLIRHIRNVFAHDKTNVSFDDSDMINICDHLKYIDKRDWGGGGLSAERPATAKSKFYQAVVYYWSYLGDVEFIKKPLRYKDHQFPFLYA